MLLIKCISKIFTGFKYLYLMTFFALLSGFFYPLITNTNFASVIIGVVILVIGLIGSILLYKFTVSQTRHILLLCGGFALISISLFYIFQITGKI